MPEQPSETIIPLSKYYRSINDLPLSKFIDCICSEDEQAAPNVYALVISGQPPHIELTEAWQSIMDQFINANAGNDHIHYVNLYRDISILTLQYNSIQQWVEGLRVMYYKPFADAINKILRTKFKFNTADGDQYRNDLNRSISRSKALKINIDLKTIHFDAAKNKQDKGGGAYDREYFADTLIILSDYVKYPLHDSITVYEYCSRFKRFLEANKKR